jgi:hypothetical protein
MSARGAALVTLAAGAAALLLPQVFLTIDSALVGATCAKPGLVVQFQLAGADAVRGLLADVRCGPERVSAAHLINLIDARLFIPAYAALLIGGARLVAGRWSGFLALGAVAAALGAAGADLIETLAQLRVTGAGAGLADAIGREADMILWAARAKYALLAANAACLAGLAFAQRPARPIMGALALLGIVGAAMVVAAPAQFWFASALGFGPLWVGLIVVAARHASIN